jgi:rRNA-processing protein FCF1
VGPDAHAAARAEAGGPVIDETRDGEGNVVPIRERLKARLEAKRNGDLPPGRAAIYVAVAAARERGGTEEEALDAALGEMGGQLAGAELDYARRCYAGGEADPRLPMLEARLQLKIGRIIQRGAGRTGRFELHLQDGGEVDLGTAGDLLVPARVQAELLAQCRRAPNLGKRSEWRRYAEAIAQLAEVVPTLSEDEALAEVLEKLENSAHAVNDENLAERISSGGITLRMPDGRVGIALETLILELKHSHGVREPPAEVARRLSRLGFESKRLVATDQRGRRRRRRYWLGRLEEWA